MLATSTLRPGLLVSLKTSCRGNVSYQTVDLDTESQDENTSDAAVAKWETTRIIADPVEFEAAKKARSKAAALIRSVCTFSAFGLLCPESDSDKLDEAVAQARECVDAFNATANLTRVHVYVIAGRIAQDDVEAMRAINSEVRELMDEMSSGISAMDAKAIRAAAAKAKQLGSMLTPDAEARVRIAVDAARSAATKIVKAGESAALTIDRSTIRKITEQRTAFLDLDVETDGEVARPATSARAIDLEQDASHAL